MAKNEQKVMAFVEKELAANPGISTTALFEKAKKLDAGIAELSIRQFNARYPLQIKRRLSQAAGGGRTARRGARRGGRRSKVAQEQQRAAVREVFLRFASDLTSAEARKDLVAVLAQVDGYVADAMKAAGR